MAEQGIVQTVLWEVDESKTKDHWLQVRDPDGWWRATCKWDGCVELHRFFNDPDTADPHDEDDVDNLHICDLPAFIKRMQALLEMAQEFFGGGEYEDGRAQS